MGYYFSKEVEIDDVEIDDVEINDVEVNDDEIDDDEIDDVEINKVELNEFCTKDDFELDSLDSIRYMFQITSSNLWIDFIDYIIDRMSPCYSNRNLRNEEKLIIVSTFFNSDDDGGNIEAKNFFYKIVCNSDGLISSKENIIIGRINKFMNMDDDIMDSDK